MAFPAKAFLSVYGTVGVGSAVGVPLVLNKVGNSSLSHEQKIVDSKSQSQISISTCNSNEHKESQETNYGKEGTKDICGTIDSEGQEGIIESSGLEYSNLFQDTGSNTEQSWKGPTFGHWSQQCLEDQGASKWAILLDPDNGFQHLGYCGDSQLAQTKFVKKSKDFPYGDNKSSGTIGICNGDCGNINSNTIAGNTEVLQTEKENKWKKVKFYERSKVAVN